MSKNILIAMGVGAVAIVIAIAGFLYLTRDTRLHMSGKFLKVRTAALDEQSSIAIVDFRLSNPSDVRAVVRTITVIAEEKNGNRLQGQTISDSDMKHVFEVMPLLGQKYNPSLVLQDKIPPHSEFDRMIASRFEVPEERITQRKSLIVSIEEIDGHIFEIREK
jgi:hypothetical protein